MFRFSLYLMLLVMMSCASEPDNFPVSQFEMQPGALEDMEEVDLLYASQAPADGSGPEYFSHYIVVSKASGDTVNVLSPAHQGIQPSDLRRTFLFLSRDSPGYASLLSSLRDHSSEDWSADSIQKVVRDPKFDDVARNNFPSVVGALARPTGEGV